MDMARNDRRLSFVTRSRAESSRTTDQSTLYALSRLKSSSSSKSDRDSKQGTGGVRDGVGGALRAVEDRHFTEAGPGLEDGQRLLARPRDGARDADIAFRDDEQAVAGLAFLEDVLPDGEFLLPA